MAAHSSTLAWRIPWMEEPGRLQSMGSRRVGHDWTTSLSLFTFMHWRRKWQPTPVFLPGESQGWEPGGLPSMGSHRVGHDWRDLAAAAESACVWTRLLHGNAVQPQIISKYRAFCMSQKGAGGNSEYSGCVLVGSGLWEGVKINEWQMLVKCFLFINSPSLTWQ